MKRLQFLTLITSLGLVAVGCSKSESKESVPVLEIENNLDKGEMDLITDKFEIIRVFQPEFTDSSIFVKPVLANIDWEKVYMYDGRQRDWMLTFDLKTGKLLNAFNHKGQGPGEYSSPAYSLYDPDTEEWTVYSRPKDFMQYTSNGNFLKKTENDSIQSLAPLKNGSWIAFNHYHENAKKLYVYNQDWNLKKIIELNDKRWNLPGYVNPDRFMVLDGRTYINQKDTVYVYDNVSEKLVPSLIIGLGKYSYDWGSIDSQQKYEEALQSSIMPFTPVFNSKYAFASYRRPYPDSELIHDVYDMTTGELVYRKIVTGNEMNNSGDFVLPLEMNGKIVYGQILDFVKDDHFLVMIPVDQLLDANGSDEINPQIVELKIK